jgi:hypothetical protein
LSFSGFFWFFGLLQVFGSSWSILSQI